MFEFEYYQCLLSCECDVSSTFSDELSNGWIHVGTIKAVEFGIEQAGINDYVYIFSRLKNH